MKLLVYSLKRVVFEGDIASLTCKTVDGELTILNHHRPLISVLAAGTVKVVDAKKEEHFIPVASGFVEINDQNQAKLLVDEA